MALSTRAGMDCLDAQDKGCARQGQAPIVLPGLREFLQRGLEHVHPGRKRRSCRKLGLADE
eukprot:15479018-Alexandrium_andersonii.AAC.1